MNRRYNPVAARERFIAKELGVTPAGLRWLAVAHARGSAPQRGNECSKLSLQGYVETKCVYNSHGRLCYTWQITPQGTAIVLRARAMGW